MTSRHRSRVVGRMIWLGTVLMISQITSCGAWFDEPRPLAVWEDPFPSGDIVKPTTYKEKNYGQWCRNFTTDEHLQCPQGSPFHWYYCCGHSNTECCLAPQTWTFVVFGSALLAASILITFTLLAQFGLIWTPKTEKQTKQTISILNYNPVKTLPSDVISP